MNTETPRRLRRTGAPAAVLGIALLAAVAGCGGGNGHGNGYGTGGTGTTGGHGYGAPSASPSASGSWMPPAGGSAVTVTETDFAIALPGGTVKPGSYTFTIVNKGQTTHALTINGPGVSDKASPEIGPGKSATLSVTLTAGKYELYCPVDGHKAMGMDTHLTVAG